MTKTSTSTNLVSSPNTQPLERAVEAEQQDELFFKSVKPQLDQLVKNPSDETISKILAYSKKN